MSRSRHGLQKCVYCNGKGRLGYIQERKGKEITVEKDCFVCLGYGYVSEEDIKEIQKDMSRCTSYMDL